MAVTQPVTTLRLVTLFQGWLINMDKESIRNSINKHFYFLFQKGFKIETIAQTGSMGCWETTLESREFSILLISDRGELFLALSPHKEKCWIGLNVVLPYITDNKILLPETNRELMNDIEKQYGRLAYYLKSYFDDIEVIFGKSFQHHKEELVKLRNQV
jgi:hypothetical protein